MFRVPSTRFKLEKVKYLATGSVMHIEKEKFDDLFVPAPKTVLQIRIRMER
jgi:hypothetical protein